jgi:hypothetical protein
MVAKVARIYVSEGSSSTEGTTGGLSGDDFAHDTYCELYAQANPSIAFQNVGTCGAVASDFLARAAIVDGYLASPGINVLSVQPMSNSIDTADQAADLDATIAYLDARRAAGWYVVVTTQLPRAVASYNTQRHIVNATIRTWLGIHCDAIADFAADPVVGIDAAGFDPSIICDGTHPAFLTQRDHMLPIISPILNARFATAAV